MTRLGNSSPSCSGFEAEPLCWLQHSANRWQQDWHSQENSSCGGQRAAERERSSQTEGEEGEGEKGRGCGEETLHSSTGPATSGADPLYPSPMGTYTCPHSHLCTPKPRCSRVLKDAQGTRATRSPPAKGTHRTLTFPSHPAAHIFQPAHLSSL